MRYSLPLIALSLLASVQPVQAQQHSPAMQHRPGMRHEPAPPPTQGGQAAFAAIAEVVAILEADSSTDWSKVDLEALRRHLMDMDALTLRSRVRQTAVPGGLQINITGDSGVAGSIRRMVAAHAPVLTALDGWSASVTEIPGGMRLTVVASDTADARRIARIRGLGFIGLMTQGAHHAEHHVMIARGAAPHVH